MTTYRRGVYREKRTADLLREDGYHVVEARGSHGAADLWAAKLGQLLLVQVKTGKARLEDGWWNELHRIALQCGGLAIVADWPSRGHLRLRRITGPHYPRSQTWPCEPFTTDEPAQEAT